MQKSNYNTRSSKGTMTNLLLPSSMNLRETMAKNDSAMSSSGAATAARSCSLSAVERLNLTYLTSGTAALIIKSNRRNVHWISECIIISIAITCSRMEANHHRTTHLLSCVPCNALCFPISS
ncbi:hypothetical protein Tcan_01667, partial [Toxocara canis]